MNRKFLGDSYDCVKASVIRWLGVGDGDNHGWALLPMVGLRETPDAIEWKESDTRSYEQMLGGRVVVDTAMLPLEFTERADKWFPDVAKRIAAAGHRRVFVDPDTGFWPKNPGSQVTSPTWHPWVYPNEIKSIWQAPIEMIAVFDQSFDRAANRRELLWEKLGVLAVEGRAALAYDAGHIAVHVVGSPAAIDDAKRRLCEHLPTGRVVTTRG